MFIYNHDHLYYYNFNYINYCIKECLECFSMRIKPDDDLSDDEEDYYVQNMNRY
jgi:hypothetical protein